MIGVINKQKLNLEKRIKKMKKGDKVTYNTGNDKFSHGIVKSVNKTLSTAFVVYNCNADWSDFEDFTGISTPIKYLKLGWEMSFKEFLTKQCDAVLLTGICKNSPDDIFMTRDRIGESLTYVVKTGGAGDWAIYIYWSGKPNWWIAENGEKVVSKDYIQKLFPCDDEVLKRYRF
jgi:hypothetical protein